MALTLAENWLPRLGNRGREELCRVTNTAGFGEAQPSRHAATTTHRSARHRVQGKQADSRPCRPPGPFCSGAGQARCRDGALEPGSREPTEAQVRKHFHQELGELW